jgi:putative FmdB family regulatory protein
MPLYKYKCTNCNRVFETRQTVAEGKKMLEEGFCLKCGAELERPFSLNVPVIQMRGYSPAHPRFFRGQRKQKGRELKKKED